MNALHVSGDNSEDRIGKHMSDVYDTTHREIACNNIFTKTLIYRGANTNDSIDRCDILNRNYIINAVNIINFKCLQIIRHSCMTY